MAESFSFFQKVNRDFDKAAQFTEYPRGTFGTDKGLQQFLPFHVSDKAGRWNYPNHSRLASGA